MKVSKRVQKLLVRAKKENEMNYKKVVVQPVKKSGVSLSPVKGRIFNSIDEVNNHFKCNFHSQHAILPRTPIPGTNFVAETVCLFTFAFSSEPRILAQVTITSGKDKQSLKENELNALSTLVERSNDSPIYDDDDDGIDLLMFFSNFAAVPIQLKDVPANDDSDLYCLQSNNGFCFTEVGSTKEYEKALKKHPEDLFVFKLVKKDVYKWLQSRKKE